MYLTHDELRANNYFAVVVHFVLAFARGQSRCVYWIAITNCCLKDSCINFSVFLSLVKKYLDIPVNFYKIFAVDGKLYFELSRSSKWSKVQRVVEYSACAKECPWLLKIFGRIASEIYQWTINTHDSCWNIQICQICTQRNRKSTICGLLMENKCFIHFQQTKWHFFGWTVWASDEPTFYRAAF